MVCQININFFQNVYIFVQNLQKKEKEKDMHVTWFNMLPKVETK